MVAATAARAGRALIVLPVDPFHSFILEVTPEPKVLSPRKPSKQAGKTH